MGKYIVGIDIGGTTCKIALFSFDMKIIHKWQIKTDLKNKGESIISHCAASILLKISERGIDKKDIYGIGIVVPGPTLDGEIVVKAVNLGWDKKRVIKDEIKKYFHKNIKVIVANDANAAAFGEYKKIKKGNINSLIMVTIGTGIGGGLVQNGKIVNGKNGCAMEIGHIKVDDGKDAIQCNCGNIGCVETICSTRGIINAFLRNIKNKKLSNIKSKIRTYDEQLIKTMSTKDICDMAKKGDKLCLYTIKNSMWYLGLVISSLILIIDPDVIVIGGGVSNCGNLIIKYIKEGVVENMKMVKNLPLIKISNLKNDAGIYGAGYLVKEE